MPKFRTTDIDLVTASLISQQARKAIRYVDDGGATIDAYGVIISIVRVKGLTVQTWEIVYLGEV
jgi:hypothetical protein